MDTNIFQVADDVVQEDERDVISGQKLDSDIYAAKLKIVYVDKSKSGAANINFIADINGQDYNETVYVTNKEGKNTYQCKNTGKKKLLPGFQQVNNVCKLLLGKEIKDAVLEEKMVKIYDYDQGKEVPMKRQVLTELVGVDVHIAIRKILQNKQVKSDSGNYVNDPTGATRDSNEIDKFFNANKQTLPEVTKERMTQEEVKAEFYQTWLDSNKGKVKDKVQKVATTTPTSTPSGTGLFA